jgi:hypothetical protein
MGCTTWKRCDKSFSSQLTVSLKMCVQFVDRPFSNGGQLMCHEDASPDANLLKTVLVLLGHLMLQHKFCKRNFRTPAWVDNVISLHGS